MTMPKGNFRRRLQRLEGKIGVASILLHFGDGGTRAVTVNDPLGLYVDLMRDISRTMPPIPEGDEPVGPEPSGSFISQMPVANQRAAILLARAVDIEGGGAKGDSFIDLVAGVARCWAEKYQM